MEYRFILTYRLASTIGSVDEIIERLGEAGCSDALVGSGRSGYLALEFNRAVDKTQLAIISILRDVYNVIPDAHLVKLRVLDVNDDGESHEEATV